MKEFDPQELVNELDKYIIGQYEAKKIVAIAIRNRWRRQQLPEIMAEEITPKNILMIGPTGVGKTEISRRLAKIIEAPFIKVEATKFTEIGYVGRDVEQIIRDLLQVSINIHTDLYKKNVQNQAYEMAEQRILNVLTKDNKDQYAYYQKELKQGKLDNWEIELEIEDKDSSKTPFFDIPDLAPGAQMGLINLSEMFSKTLGNMNKKYKTKCMNISDALKLLVEEESEKLIDHNMVIKKSIDAVENRGIVFIDEIDKIAARGGQNSRGGEVSREGVQRDLLPLIEGTIVNTKYGNIRTDHILFIVSGAFMVCRPSDLLPELQGRLPVRVNLKALSKEDFCKILTETKFSLIKQYEALIKTEGIDLSFTSDAVDTIAEFTEKINNSIENIGARRLYTIMEKILEQISFSATSMHGQKIVIDSNYVHNQLKDFNYDIDLSKFIL